MVVCSAGLLNLTDRVDWKACVGTTEEETQATKALRNDIKPFDFTRKK
jgi:hypothetical protein